MPRKKRPPVPQTHHGSAAKPSRPRPRPNRPAVVLDDSPKTFQDRLAVVLYYVPLLLASWMILSHEVKTGGGHFSVKHWPWILALAILWGVGPFYLRMLREVRLRQQAATRDKQ